MPNTNWALPSLLTTSVSSVYPTAEGLSTGLQGGLAGDQEFQDRNADFINSFNRAPPSQGIQQPFPARGGGAGPTGGQNRQRGGY